MKTITIGIAYEDGWFLGDETMPAKGGADSCPIIFPTPKDCGDHVEYELPHDAAPIGSSFECGKLLTALESMVRDLDSFAQSAPNVKSRLPAPDSTIGGSAPVACWHFSLEEKKLCILDGILKRSEPARKISISEARSFICELIERAQAKINDEKKIPH